MKRLWKQLKSKQQRQHQQKLTGQPNVSSQLESLIEEEEEETGHGPGDADGLAVVLIDGPLHAADLHLLIFDQNLTDGSFGLVDLEVDSIKIVKDYNTFTNL